VENLQDLYETAGLPKYPDDVQAPAFLFHPVLQTIRKGGIAVMAGNKAAAHLNLLQQRSMDDKTSTYLMTSGHKHLHYLKEI
jgi:hypothetical protein